MILGVSDFGSLEGLDTYASAWSKNLENYVNGKWWYGNNTPTVDQYGLQHIDFAVPPNASWDWRPTKPVFDAAAFESSVQNMIQELLAAAANQTYAKVALPTPALNIIAKEFDNLKRYVYTNTNAGNTLYTNPANPDPSHFWGSSSGVEQASQREMLTTFYGNGDYNAGSANFKIITDFINQQIKKNADLQKMAQTLYTENVYATPMQNARYDFYNKTVIPLANKFSTSDQQFLQDVFLNEDAGKVTLPDLVNALKMIAPYCYETDLFTVMVFADEMILGDQMQNTTETPQSITTALIALLPLFKKGAASNSLPTEQQALSTIEENTKQLAAVTAILAVGYGAYTLFDVLLGGK